MFGKKKQPEEIKKEEETAQETINITRNPFKKTKLEVPPLEEPTIQEVIANNTELWYKTEMYAMLIEVLETLREFKK